MYGEPRGGIFQHIAGVLQYRKRARLREAHTPESSQPAATRGRRPKGAAAITPVSRHGANFIRIIADRPPLSRGGRQPQLTAEDLAVVEPVSSCTFTGWDTAVLAYGTSWANVIGCTFRNNGIGFHFAWSTASGCTFTGNRFRFNCTDSTPGHSLYNENTFEYNGIAVLLKSVPSDPAPDFQNSVFPGNDTDIRLSPGGWAHRESQGVRPGILSKSRLVFYGTLPNFL